MRSLCKGCTIVALDVARPGRRRRATSGASTRRWPQLDRSRAKIVGIHNYSDTNRASHGRGTKAIIKAVRHYNRRTQFWLTETGGVVNFGRASSATRSARRPRSRDMFKLARTSRRYIKRLYVYNWTGADCNGFDTGLTRADGSLRPAYTTLRKYLKTFTR